MKEIKRIVLLSLLLVSVVSFSQTFSIKGKVVDEYNLPLENTVISIKKLSLKAETNALGEYTFRNLEPNTYTMSVEHKGFEGEQKTVNLNEDKIINFVLRQGIMLEGLTVTAQKREQSIKEIPTAVTSLSNKFIENLNTTDISNLADYIPGLQVQIQSPNNPGFVVRGITSDDGASNIEPRVSVFQDGVSISKSRGSVVEVFDMERVEVLKGPQGTLFGRGAQIGAVHLIQNKPKNYFQGGLKAGIGNLSYKHLEAYGNIPIVKGKLLTRVAGIYKKRDGYIKNLSGGTLNGKDTKAVRASLKWLPAKDLNFTLIANYQKDTPPGTGFKSGTYAPKGGDTKFYTFADLERGIDLGLKRDVWGLSLLSKYDLNSSLTLNAITAYRTFNSNEAFDADGTVAPALFFREQAEGKQFSQELRLNFNLGDKFEGFAGVNFFSENGSQRVPLVTDERSFFTLISPLVAPVINEKLLKPLNDLYQVLSPGYPKVQINPLPLVSGGAAVLPKNMAGFLSHPLIPFASLPAKVQANPNIQKVYGLLNAPFNPSHKEYFKNYGDNQSYEFFADGTYKITDKLKATTGIRFTIENIKSSYESDGEGNSFLGFALSAGKNILTMPTPLLSKEKTFKSWVGRLALNYALTESTEMYLSLAKGRRPNVIQFISVPKNDGSFTSSYEPKILKEEIVKSYEMGLKTLSRNGSLYFDFSGFYYDYSNFQTSVVDPATLRIIQKDAGDATAYGAETSIKWKAMKNISLFANYSYINAKFNDKDSDGNKQEYAGNTFRLTPKHSFSLGGNFSVPLANNTINLFFIPSYKYKSRVYFEQDNKDIESQESYGLLDLRTGVDFRKLNLKVTLFMNNALDKKYLIDAGNTGRSFGIPTYIAGTPRLFGLETSYKF